MNYFEELTESYNKLKKRKFSLKEAAGTAEEGVAAMDQASAENEAQKVVAAAPIFCNIYRIGWGAT